MPHIPALLKNFFCKNLENLCLTDIRQVVQKRDHPSDVCASIEKYSLASFTLPPEHLHSIARTSSLFNSRCVLNPGILLTMRTLYGVMNVLYEYVQAAVPTAA